MQWAEDRGWKIDAPSKPTCITTQGVSTLDKIRTKAIPKPKPTAGPPKIPNIRDYKQMMTII